MEQTTGNSFGECNVAFRAMSYLRARFVVVAKHSLRSSRVPMVVSLFSCLAISIHFGSDARATVVRYQFSLNGSSIGSVDVRLFDSAMPRTVANFLQYVDDNDWDGSFIHRRAALSDSGVAVIQGGGYKVPPTGLIEPCGQQLCLDFDQVPPNAAIADEPGGGIAGPSNLRGTIAMAKSGPNTVTSQWFFNTIDNTVLDDATDPDTGGFSAFGRVLGNGMTVIDNIWNLPRYPLVGPFTHLPVYSVSRINAQVDVFNMDVVLVTDVRRLNIPAGDYDFNGTVNAADYSIWKNSFGSTTNASADGNGNGRVDAADYTIWRNTFGQTSVPGSGSIEVGSLPLPEPTAALLAAVGTLIGFQAARRSRAPL